MFSSFKVYWRSGKRILWKSGEPHLNLSPDSTGLQKLLVNPYKSITQGDYMYTVRKFNWRSFCGALCQAFFFHFPLFDET